MRRLLLAVLLTVLATLAVGHAAVAKRTQFRWLRYTPRTILISPTGHPIGGRWQAWMNASKIPTYGGLEVLALNRQRTLRVCVDATGCSAPAAPCLYSTCGLGHPETWLMPGDSRDDLYYEHGHIVDFTLATNADRSAFMRIWRLRGTPADWWRGAATFPASGVMPPGEMWSAAYQLCADGVSDADSISEAQGRWSAPRWAPKAQRASCRLFRRVASRQRG